jgi:hypothetical protein
MKRQDSRGPEVLLMDLPGLNPVEDVHIVEATSTAGGEKHIDSICI